MARWKVPALNHFDVPNTSGHIEYGKIRYVNCGEAPGSSRSAM
jgi:hypothetical protein